MPAFKTAYLAAAIAMLLVTPVSAKSLWTQIDEISPLSSQPAEFVERDMGAIFTDLADVAPRSGGYFDTLADQAP
jgi:hypothetical protein